MMAKRLGLLIPLLLLGQGCVPGNDPLLPELKGRWSAPNAAKLRNAAAAERYANPPAQTASGDCRNEYVTFEKYGVVIYMNGQVNPVFMVQSVKREGARLILDGHAPLLAGGHSGRIELVLRNGEVRLDDVINERGRSILYERFDNEQARRLGVTTVGDIFRLVLDVKPCRV
jgi:hypothetical protein